MIVSLKHETPNDIVIDLFTIIADAREMDYIKAGSTNFKRQDLASGFDPDSCFYIEHTERMRGKDAVDLTIDPPPDLVIDIANVSLPRFPVFAAVGVPEVWRHDGSKISIHRLDKNTGEYQEIARSAALPGVTGEVLTRFTQAGLTEKRQAWLKRMRKWTPELARD